MKKVSLGKKAGGKMGTGMMNKMMPSSPTSFLRPRPKKK